MSFDSPLDSNNSGGQAWVFGQAQNPFADFSKVSQEESQALNQEANSRTSKSKQPKDIFTKQEDTTSSSQASSEKSIVFIDQAEPVNLEVLFPPVSEEVSYEHFDPNYPDIQGPETREGMLAAEKADKIGRQAVRDLEGLVAKVMPEMTLPQFPGSEDEFGEYLERREQVLSALNGIKGDSTQNNVAAINALREIITDKTESGLYFNKLARQKGLFDDALVVYDDLLEYQHQKSKTLAGDHYGSAYESLAQEAAGLRQAVSVVQMNDQGLSKRNVAETLKSNMVCVMINGEKVCFAGVTPEEIESIKQNSLGTYFNPEKANIKELKKEHAEQLQKDLKATEFTNSILEKSNENLEKIAPGTSKEVKMAHTLNVALEDKIAVAIAVEDKQVLAEMPVSKKLSYLASSLAEIGLISGSILDSSLLGANGQASTLHDKLFVNKAFVEKYSTDAAWEPKNPFSTPLKELVQRYPDYESSFSDDHCHGSHEELRQGSLDLSNISPGELAPEKTQSKAKFLGSGKEENSRIANSTMSNVLSSSDEPNTSSAPYKLSEEEKHSAPISQRILSEAYEQFGIQAHSIDELIDKLLASGLADDLSGLSLSLQMKIRDKLLFRFYKDPDMNSQESSEMFNHIISSGGNNAEAILKEFNDKVVERLIDEAKRDLK